MDCFNYPLDSKMLLEYEKIILKIRSYKNGLRFYNEEYVNKKNLL